MTTDYAGGTGGRKLRLRDSKEDTLFERYIAGGEGSIASRSSRAVKIGPTLDSVHKKELRKCNWNSAVGFEGTIGVFWWFDSCDVNHRKVLGHRYAKMPPRQPGLPNRARAPAADLPATVQLQLNHRTMVLLTMTPAIVRALSRAEDISPEEFGKLQLPSEPSLAGPQPGNPISHSQLIDLSKLLKKHASATSTGENQEEEPVSPTKGAEAESAPAKEGEVQAPASSEKEEAPEDPRSAEEDQKNEPVVYTLNTLLRSSKIYIPPPPPKPEPSPSYVALMARLRAEEEARAYTRMLNPPTSSFTSARRPPSAPVQFSIGTDAPLDEDDVGYEEVHRQMILIINVLVSIVACAVFIWVAARHWSVAKRLGLSMGGSGAVAIAEVAVYSGYVRRVKEAKRREKKKPEIKEIVQSWVIDRDSNKEVPVSGGLKGKPEECIRYRKGKHR